MVCSDISRWQTCVGLSPQVRQRCSVGKRALNLSNFDFLHIPKGTTRANVLRYGQLRVARLIQIPILIGRQITFKHISGLIRTWHRMNCPIVGRASSQEGTKGGSVKRYKKYTVHFS